MAIEQTVVLVKPDAVKRNLVGEILSRFERADLRIVWLCMGSPELGFWKAWYENVLKEHGKEVYENQTTFMNSGGVVGVVLEGDDAIHRVRKLVGATNPRDAAAGTIRGDFGSRLPQTLVHASDSPESAERESMMLRSLIW